MNPVTLLGFVAGTLTTLAFLPQVVNHRPLKCTFSGVGPKTPSHSGFASSFYSPVLTKRKPR